MGQSPPSSEASDHHIFERPNTGAKKGGGQTNAVSLTGLGEWFFRRRPAEEIARGRSLMSFIFVQKMSGIDTESIMGCKLVKL
ncbi:hypothetical protein PR729_05890 [Providencia rettgeri]|nr:hypothetical protein PR729_05890 [Providencia rettgeri]